MLRHSNLRQQQQKAACKNYPWRELASYLLDWSAALQAFGATVSGPLLPVDSTSCGAALRFKLFLLSEALAGNNNDTQGTPQYQGDQHPETLLTQKERSSQYA